MSKAKKVNPRRGSSFDKFLKKQGIYEEVAAQAQKEILAWKLQSTMKNATASSGNLPSH